MRQECWSRAKKGEMSALKEKWETAFHGRRTDSGRKEIHVFVTTGLILVREHHHPLLLWGSWPRLTQASFLKTGRGASPSGLKGKTVWKVSSEERAQKPSCDFWHPSVCLNHKSESGCKFGDKCRFLRNEAVGQLSWKSEERWRKRIGGFVERDYSFWLCVLRKPSGKVCSSGK